MPSEKIIQLHQALAERGFSVRPLVETERADALVEIPLLKGELSQGELVEISTQATPGGGLIMREVIHALAARGLFLAVVDGTDGFDPGSFESAILTRILWVRTRAIGEAIKAADLLLRDGNLPLVLLQLRGVELANLRRVPSQHWYRLQHLAKQTGTTCLAITPQPVVPCARKRWLVEGNFGLDDLEREAVEVLPRLHAQVQWRQGGQQRTAVGAHAG